MENKDFELVKVLAKALGCAKEYGAKVRIGKTNYYIQVNEYEEEQTTITGWFGIHIVMNFALIDSAKKVIFETSADKYIIDVAYEMLEYIK